MTVPTGQKSLPKEQPKPDEALQAVCTELETVAAAEAGDEEGASGLLDDDAWLGKHIDQVLASFQIDDGSKTALIARIRKRYGANGDE